MTRRPYVGFLPGGKRVGEVFRADAIPTEQSHGKRFAYAVGPFRTARAARWLVANPFVHGVVSEIERRSLPR